MGLIGKVFTFLFGDGRNVVADTVEVFRENAEAGAVRSAEARNEALEQFGDEFRATGRGAFDRVMDAINRVPRPAMAIGTLGLFIAAMVDPLWFAARMQGIALVPEPLWWLLGVVVSFYFGARHQFKGQEFQRQIVQTMALAPQVGNNIASLNALSATRPGEAQSEPDAILTLAAIRPEGNPALEEWARQTREAPPATM